MKAKVRTCLWYASQAEEAAKFYVSLLPGSRIESVSRFEHGGTGEPDGVTLVEFTLAGAPYQAMSAGPHHDFNDAMSIVVLTSDQKETDRLWEALTANGGKPVQCGWLRDRFGVSWQIVPEALTRMVAGKDKQAAHRAIQAMISMQKIDIAAVERAFRG